MIYTEHPSWTFGPRLPSPVIPRFPAADVSSLASHPRLRIAAGDGMAAFVRRRSSRKRRSPTGLRTVPGISRTFQRGRDATEHLTEPSPQRATLRLSGPRVLRRGTERCWTWTRLITAGRPRYLGACRLYYKPPTPMPSTRIPFRLFASFGPRRPRLSSLLLAAGSFLRASRANTKYRLNPVDRNIPRELWPLPKNISRTRERWGLSRRSGI